MMATVMPTRDELRELALLRLLEAETLFKAELYDGCVYLCGYVIEFALKACICQTLSITAYPDNRAFLTHDFDELRLLAGLQEQINIWSGQLLGNWSVATDWKPEWRYQRKGTYEHGQAQERLRAIKADPDGVLTYLMGRW